MTLRKGDICSVNLGGGGGITSTADDLENVEVVVDGVAYTPTVVGNRYTGNFGNDLAIGTGFSKDVYIQGDLKESAAGKKVQMDITESTDVVFTGEVSGERLKISAGQGAISPNIASRFTGGTPWFRGSTLIVEPLEPSTAPTPSSGGGGGGGGPVVVPTTPPAPTPPPVVVEELPVPEVKEIGYWSGDALWCLVVFKSPAPEGVNRVEWSIPGEHVFVDDSGSGLLWNSERTGLGFRIFSLPPELQGKQLGTLRELLRNVETKIQFFRLHP